MSAHSIFMSHPEALVLRERAPVPHAASVDGGSVDGTFSSERLLNGRREILIRHGDCVYRLRHTSNDKLILTK